MNLGFGKKLYIGSFGIIILTILIIAAVNFYQSRNAFLSNGKTSIENVADVMLKSMSLNYNLQHRKMDSDLGMLVSRGAQNSIMMVEARTVDMDLTDRESGKKSKETLPKIIFGLAFVTAEYDVVDFVGNMSDSEIAIYQFHNNKLIKVSTSLKNTDDSRPIGDYYTQESNVYKELQAGKTYKTIVENGNALYMQIFKPFSDTLNNTVVGAYCISSEILTVDVISLVNSINVSGKGYSFIATQDGKILTHPDPAYVNRQVQAFDNGEAILKTTHGFVNYSDRNQPYYAYVNYFENWRLFFGVAVSEPELMAGMNRQILISSGISGILALIIGTLIIAFMNRQLMTQMNGMARLAKEVSMGNFRHTFTYHAKDAIQDTVTSMNEMVKGLAEMITELNQGVETLSVSSGELNQIAEQMSKGSETTLQKLNTVASAAEEMSVNMNSVATAMEQASTNVEVVASGTSDMSVNIEKVAQNSKNTQKITGKAVEQAEKASARIIQLGKAAEEINKVTDAINNISSQTNLLALNATIEAARAGEAGKGFAVVASEIKDLAGQTAGATEDIAKNIRSIQDEIQGAVTEIKEISSIINQINAFVNDAAGAIESQSATTSEISENISQVSLGIQEVNENVSQSSSVSGQVAQDISDVLSASQAIHALSSDVKEKSVVLNKVMEQLQALTSRFRI